MLRDFYYNEEMRTQVQEYLVEYLHKRAIEKVFDREDTSGVAEAKEIIDGAFENLSSMFEVVKKREQIDEAR